MNLKKNLYRLLFSKAQLKKTKFEIRTAKEQNTFVCNRIKQLLLGLELMFGNIFFDNIEQLCGTNPRTFLKYFTLLAMNLITVESQ